MKYVGMPHGMWLLFKRSFEHCLSSVLGFEKDEAARITKAAKSKYKEVIDSLPEFEKGDRFKMNIVNCAMLASFYINMEKKPKIEQMTKYYRESMMTGVMKLFCKKSGKRTFTDKYIAGMKKTASFKAADRNKYSWNMEFRPYSDGSGYEARFDRCGICTLMRELGIPELVPAMCALDYSMTEAGGTAAFVREYTLASGGPYCDCGYKKKVRV